MRSFLPLVALAILAAFALPSTAHPLVPLSSSGTLVADAFSSCVPGANCDVLVLDVDAGVPHTITHTVLASHSGGFPPAFNLYLRLVAGGTVTPIAGCPDVFTPGSPGATQTCILPAQTSAVRVVGYFEALRPHQTGIVTFTHTLSAV